jgi:hypothetical protein
MHVCGFVCHQPHTQPARRHTTLVQDEEASAALAETTPAERLIARLWRVVLVLLRTELVQALKKAINPPVTAVFAGLALGLSPAGAVVSDAGAAAAFVGTHAAAGSIVAWELGLITSILRCCWETVEMLASGTLALQALVLAASLFGGSSSSSQPAAAAAAGAADGSAGGGSSSKAARSGGSSSSSSMAQGTVELMSPGGGRSDLDRPLMLGGSALSLAAPGGSSSSSSSNGGVGIKLRRQSASTADGASASVLQQLLPQSAWEWRAMAAVAAVRFVLLPAASCWLVLGAVRIGLLPPDPACTFMLLLQSCMPPGECCRWARVVWAGGSGLSLSNHVVGCRLSLTSPTHLLLLLLLPPLLHTAHATHQRKIWC